MSNAHALCFDGSAVTGADPTGLPTGASPWSLACWYKVDASTLGSANQTLIDFGWPNSGGNAILFLVLQQQFRQTSLTQDLVSPRVSHMRLR